MVGQIPPTGDFAGHMAVPTGVHERCREVFESYAPGYAQDRVFEVNFALPTMDQWYDDN